MTNIRLPNFIVIGAPKSGTTSLFYYLRQHPEIYLSKRKELHYFSYDELILGTKGPGDMAVVNSLCSNIDEYKRHFIKVSTEKAIGDVSPSYLYYSASAMKIKNTLGEVKIIVLLRNPVDKAFSQYMHLVRENREKLSCYEALLAERKRQKDAWSDIWRYAESSLYSKKVETYYNVFGRSNVLLVFFETFLSEPSGVMKTIFEFLDVRTDFNCDTTKQYNRTGVPRSKFVSDFFSTDSVFKNALKYVLPEAVRTKTRLRLLDMNTGAKPEIDIKSKQFLQQYFENDVDALRVLLGRELPWVFE